MMTTISPLTRELDNQGTVRIGNEDVGEPGLVSWKDCWDSLLNDSRFRSFYIGGNVYEYVMPVNFAPSPEDGFLRKFDGIDISGFVKKNPTYVSYQKRRLRKFDTSKLKGSILIKGGGEEDHYVSFRIKGSVLKIFDPADTSGRYDSYFPVRYRKILSIITGKRVVLSERHPQCTPGDTFCQTWTVARLNSSLKQYTKYTPRKSSPIATRIKSSVPHMYNIVHAIAHSPKFLEYLSKPDVHAKFNKIFKKSRMYYKLPIPKDLTAYFIALSRKIKPRHIESIFRGD